MALRPRGWRAAGRCAAMARGAALIPLTMLVIMAMTGGEAWAASVSVQPREGIPEDGKSYPSFYPTVVVTADPGERNVLSVTRSDENSEVLVTDAGAPLRAGAGCRAEGPLVRCGGREVELDLGDGDDRLVVRGDPQFPITFEAEGGDAR